MHNRIEMELFVEKAVLDRLNLDLLKEDLSLGQKKMRDILYSYDGISFYTDVTFDAIKFENYKLENLLFAKIVERNIIISISLYEFVHSTSYNQTLFFTLIDEDWFVDAEKKGGLCFSYKNFEKKIEEMVSICAELKIDLSEQFVGWEYFKQLKTIPKNRIFINDGYLFAPNSGNKPIDENVIPLLKNKINPNSETKVEIYTDYLNNAHITIDSIKNKLNNVFKSDYELTFSYIQWHFHDRILYSNFFMIGCGVGFNFNKNKKSNSIITVDSVFDKFTYNRMNNHLRLLKSKKENAIVVSSPKNSTF